MLKLDHFVVHIDESSLSGFKQACDDAQIPFEPTWGKGTKGFKVANVWVGDEYLELVWLKRPDGGGWRPDWVQKYQQGHRGLTAIMLLTDDLAEVQQRLVAQGFSLAQPERISFRWLVFKKSLPWRTLYLPPIPGTDVQLTFSQHDSPAVLEKFRPHMVPNAREVGVTGLEQATVKAAFSPEARDFLTQVFPKGRWREDSLQVGLSGGHNLTFLDVAKVEPTLELYASGEQARRTVSIENLSLSTASCES